MNKFAVSFVVRASKANKEGLSPVELSISINGGKSSSDWPRKPNRIAPFCQNKVDPSDQNKNDPIEM